MTAPQVLALLMPLIAVMFAGLMALIVLRTMAQRPASDRAGRFVSGDQMLVTASAKPSRRGKRRPNGRQQK